MASYVPPKEQLPIFDDLMFVNQTDAVTIEYANKHYLRYPNAQGTENMLDTNVNGFLTVNGSQTISSYVPMGYSQFNITNINGNYKLYTRLNDNPGNGNPIIEFADITIISQNEDLTLTTYSSTTSGVNIEGNRTIIGSGGTALIPTSSLVCDGTASTVTINNPTPAVYGPSTVQPAPTDSTTKIPSTAWVQSLVSTISTPVGTVHAYAGKTTPPTGYLFCDGSLISQTTYAALYAVIGTTYGPNPSGLFTLPTMMSGNPNVGVFPCSSYGPNNTGIQVIGPSIGATYPVSISSVGQALSTLRPQAIPSGTTPSHTHSITFPDANYVNNVNTTNNTTTGGTAQRAVSGPQSAFPTATGDIVYASGIQQADYVPIYTCFTWIIKY